MNNRNSGSDFQQRVPILAAALGVSCCLVFNFAAAFAQEQPIDRARELKMKITAPFTLVVAGDLIECHTVSQLEDPGVQGVLRVIRDGDVGFANMEASIANYRHPVSPVYGTTGPAQDAADVKAMGFKILSRANNHATENDTAGMFATDQYLDDQGLAYAGVGRNLAEARAPQFYEGAKGRVGLVSMSATGSPNSSGGISATYDLGNVGGYPGVNSLHVTMYQLVTAEQLETLRKIRDSAYAHLSEVPNDPVPPIPANEPKDRLRMSRVGEWYKIGTPPGGLSYTMNQDDLRDNLRSIRNGKELSDFMIATIHAHEDPSSLQMAFFSHYPPDYLIELAHQSIDNGADVFATTGPHALRGIEIYKGKPIFYGLSSFVKQSSLELAPLERYTAQKADPFTTDMTQAEAQWLYWDSFARPEMSRVNLDGILWECKFDKGRLVEIILHPLDLGFDAPLSQKGIPRPPSPENAQRILHEMQTYSKPFGTTISIEGNIGIIRITPDVAQN